MSTAKILLYTKTLIFTLKTNAFRTKTLITTPKPTISTQSLLCLQVIHSREAFGKSDFRVFNSLVRV